MSKAEKDRQIKQLLHLNDELENYFRNTIIPQLFVDANLILRKFTPPAMKQFRFSADHIGRPLEEVVDNIRYSTIQEDIRQVIRTGQILEKEIQTTDNRWFQMNIIPYLVDSTNTTNGVIITFVDITDRIMVLRELEKVNTSHETFIFSVTHDLKTPLENIQGLVGILIETSNVLAETKGIDNGELKIVAGMLQDSVQAIKRIMDELGDIAKAEGNYQETAEAVSFEEILREVELTLKDKIIESGAHISVDIQEPVIAFSRKNLRSIIYNLLSNAIKYRSPAREPQIQIQTATKEGMVVISIKDNGLGIADEQKDFIFKRFCRIGKEVEGTGIGLYLVKRIVENEGGSVTVNSEPGKGSEFVVALKRRH